MDIPKALQDSVCAAIVRLENGWTLIFDDGTEITALLGFTMSEELDDHSKEKYEAVQQLLFTILESVLWMPNSKHNPYRIEINVVNQLSTKKK